MRPADITRPVTLVAAIACAIALGACDSETDEANDYVGEVNDVTQQLRTETTEALDEAGVLTAPEDIAGVYAKFSTQLTTAAAEIEEITPPEDVAQLHARLVKEIRALSAEAKNASDQVKQGGAASATVTATQFIDEADDQSARIDSTLAEINQILQG